MKQHYSVVFQTAGGPKRSIQVRNPNTDIAVAELSAAIAQILLNDVFDPAKGSLESFSKLELLESVTTQIL